MKTLISIVAVLAATSAYAEEICNDRDTIVKGLGDRFEERRTAYGLTAPGQLLEIFTAENGTWTIVVTTPDLKSCIVAGGEAWTVTPVLVGRPI